jgi:hypothetical protein
LGFAVEKSHREWEFSFTFLHFNDTKVNILSHAQDPIHLYLPYAEAYGRLQVIPERCG